MLYKVVNQFYNFYLAKGKYCKKYYPGTTVKAVPGTYGLMLFSDLRWINSFMGTFEREVAIFLEVEGIGKSFVPLNVCGVPSEYCIDRFYDISNPRDSDIIIPRGFVPIGTVCYPKVKVLREISQN